MALADFLDTVTIWDLVDILAVALVIYVLLLLIQRTRALRVLIGILVLLGIFFLARVLNLKTLDTLLASALTSLPLVAVVLFRDQIRSALAGFGSTRLWGLGNRADPESTFNEIVLAATTLAKNRVGALIVIEGDEGLREFIERGNEIDAALSCELLVNIFTPGAPLHDGAVIVRDKKIAAAACVLPLTRQTRLPSDLGTRHRAALGISDETDAIAVVVSEETGQISVAYRGELTLDLDSNELRSLLYKRLIRERESTTEVPSE